MKVNNSIRHCFARDDKVFLFFFLLSAFSFQLSALCFSQEDTTAKAKEYFLAGNRLLEAGNYAQADAEFKKAQDLLKTPAVVLPAPVQSGPLPEKTPDAPVKKTAPKPGKAGPKKAHPELNIPRDMTPEEAISFYRRAAENIPRNPSLPYNLAIAYLQTKQYPLAAEAFKKAVSLNPKDSQAYYNLAVLYENHLGSKKQALLYYGRYLKLSPLAEDSQKVQLWMRQIKEELKLNE